MGLLSKIKDILFEEEEVEIPIVKKEKEEPKKTILPKKKEEPQRKIMEDTIDLENIMPKKAPVLKREPIEERQKEPVIKDRDLYKSEPTFGFPIAFEEEVSTPSRSNRNVLEKENNQRNYNHDSYQSKVVEEPKTFKPSPVISPVFGILDKNYNVNSQTINHKKTTTHKNELDLDVVRQKAYGTLEDDIVNTFSKSTEDFYDINKEKKMENTDEMLLDIKDVEIKAPKKNIEDELEETPIEPSKTMAILDEIENGLDKKKTEKERLENDTLESDLFNLIDSMYEKKEGGE